MALPVRLDRLEEQVRWQADMLRADLRHTSADIRAELNESIRRYREMISDRGNFYFLAEHAGTMPIGQTPARGDGSVNLPFAVMQVEGLDPFPVRIYGVDLMTTDGELIELERVEFQQRNFYQHRRGTRGRPMAFFVYDGTRVALLPPPDSAYKYVLWYLPDIKQITEDSDIFDSGLPGGDKWVIWDTCAKLASRDNFPAMLAAAMNGKAEMEATILRKPLVNAGGMERLDTAGRARRKYRRDDWSV